MSQSLVKNYIHIVFSTKHRENFIDEKIENELFAYIAAICKDFDSNALQFGGTDNHIHILCSLSKKIALMKLVQEIKAHSSKWIKTKGRKYENFFWQDGYGAFSVSEENLYTTIYTVQKNIKMNLLEFWKSTEYNMMKNIYGTDYYDNYNWILSNPDLNRPFGTL